MSRPEKNIKYGIIALLIILGVSTRFLFLVPGFESIANFTAIGALCLFSGAYLSRKQAILLVLGVMWATDLFLNNVVYAAYYESFQWHGNIWVYLALAYVVILSRWFLKFVTAPRIMMAAFLGALVFFLLTNFESWIRLPEYTKDLDGLLQAYSGALPFLKNTLISNMVYSFVLFGVYEMALRGTRVLIPSLVRSR